MQVKQQKQLSNPARRQRVIAAKPSDRGPAWEVPSTPSCAFAGMTEEMTHLVPNKEARNEKGALRRPYTKRHPA